MAIYNEDIIDVELTGGNIARSFMKKTIGEGDALANRFGIRAYRNGVAENLGGTCLGLFIRADGGTVPVEGVVSGNEAYVELTQACYAVEGQFALAIKVTNGNATGTLRIVDGIVDNTTTGSAVDPGTVIPSIETLIAEIEAAVASIPADYSSLWTSLAPAFSNSKAYVPGQYVTYDGKVYRFFVNHPAGSWDAAHVNQIDIGGELTNVTKYEQDDSDWRQRNTTMAGNLLPFYVARYEGFYVSDYHNELILIASSDYVAYIIPVEKNTQYIFTFGRHVALLGSDRRSIIGSVTQSIYSINSGDAYYIAISFNKTTYPESTYKFNIRQTGDQDVRNEPSVIEIDKLRLTSDQQKYLTANIYQDGWELGDIKLSDGTEITSSTTLRTKEYCRVFPSDTCMITADSVEHGQTVGYLYQYSKSLAYAGTVNVITILNGIPFTLTSVTEYVRIVLSSSYGTTFKNDLMFYQPGGMVRDITELLRARMPANSKVIIVSKYGDGDYTSLRHAVMNASDGDVIFVRRGVYENEEVEAWDKNITIIGESPYNTIIQNETDAYATPPLEMSVGAIYNLCFHAIAHTSNKKAYALHIDNDNQENGTFYAENCIFISDDGPAAVGAGSRINHRQVYKNCIFENKTNEPAFFGNEATNQQTAGVVNNQYYEFYDCTFKTPGAHQYVVIMRGMKAEGNTVWCVFKDCSFMDDGTTEHPVFRMDYTNEQYIGTATTMGNMGMVNWNLDPISSGNTIPELNTCPDGVIMRYGPIGS